MTQAREHANTPRRAPDDSWSDGPRRPHLRRVQRQQDLLLLRVLGRFAVSIPPGDGASRGGAAGETGNGGGLGRPPGAGHP